MNQPRRLVLLGHPVAHSLSPVMQNAALAAAGIQLRYEALDVLPDALAATLDLLAAEGAAGNITVPHKQAAFLLMSRPSATAERIGAVNAFRTLPSGEIEGDNTDSRGFHDLVTFALGTIPVGARVAVIGAGGTAAAVLAAIERWPGARATVYARNRERGEKLVARFRNVARLEMMEHGGAVAGNIVVNATPIGLDDDDVPVSVASLERDATVLDLVYRPGETAWTRTARASGHVASDGLPMLLSQGALAFQMWFGIAPDREAMWNAVKAETGRS